MDVLTHATAIVKKLVRAGFIAYFAGGWVRDHVMGHDSADIDIATSAAPLEIMDLFPNTILVGLAFGVVIVVIEGHQFEVATFRKDLHYINGRKPEGIELSTPEEDALRRDFTINGLFYDPLEHIIHDYVHGIEDIKKGIIRTIGNPHERFFEDRLRMLRAFRFSARFGFAIDPVTQQAIKENANKFFPAVAMERVWQEFNKMASYPRFDQAIVEMHRLELLDEIFPELRGLHLKELRHFVSAYAHFPKSCPTILYLMELFPALSLEQKIDICRRMKGSGRDIKLLEFFHRVQTIVEQKEKPVSDYAWAHLFAHPDSFLCLEVLAARLTEKERILFLQSYRERYENLLPFIKRIRDKKPLISALDLQQRGIKPGKKMGLLLQEAERLSVETKTENADFILEALLHTPLWNIPE